MMHRLLETGEVRDVLGMRSPAAWVIVALFSVNNLVTAVWNDEGVDALWLVIVAALLAILATIGVMVLPGDPLPARYAIAIAAASPVVAVMVYSQLPVPMFNTQQRWFFGATTVLLVFLCVRGATVWAWAGMTARIAVASAWTAHTGQGAALGFATSVVDVAPLLMATFFAYTVRPTAQSIVRLREQTNARAASEAAAVAVLDERDAQLDRLDAIARPLLERIASGALLTPSEQEECGLIEAQLRDRLRAELMVDESVAESARLARRRGVSVVLLDDGGLADSSEDVRQAVRTATASALDFANSGSVAARVLPPGRDKVATVLVREGADEYRIEVDQRGDVRSDLVDLIAS